MKGRESGMPEEAYWESFFDADRAVETLLGDSVLQGDLVEFGCGYGTFTLPAARRITGKVTALDIEPDMLASLRCKAEAGGLPNIHPVLRDFVAHGTGIADGSQAHAMIYNLLHLENPHALLAEAHRILRPAGVLSVIHWRSDIPTPRGPSLAIRPSLDQCRRWMVQARFESIELIDLQHCCPFHFGLIGRR
ncbi:class I SAM-dependent methyltransferase [Propionivibrio dicarboxylicus]|uniref:Methyltransferase domain-containing protein n=1 Tax=Propionivibrio dicarboxylicus TaxID=83767 RepID=A0A1G8EVG2_9RHOO|nr:class I SAM-dependent methyltransferase [Propionivibrio dicarboxylicus]SDH73896.1 Methyltransferase domain-containing protein [Propionivibrio dicarboxylicus]